MTQTPTQNQAIKAHLERGLPIMGMEALHRYGCFRLPARISDLKKRGMRIESRIVKLENGKRVAEYRAVTA